MLCHKTFLPDFGLAGRIAAEMCFCRIVEARAILRFFNHVEPLLHVAVKVVTTVEVVTIVTIKEAITAIIRVVATTVVAIIATTKVEATTVADKAATTVQAVRVATFAVVKAVTTVVVRVATIVAVKAVTTVEATINVLALPITIQMPSTAKRNNWSTMMCCWIRMHLFA